MPLSCAAPAPGCEDDFVRVRTDLVALLVAIATAINGLVIGVCLATALCVMSAPTSSALDIRFLQAALFVCCIVLCAEFLSYTAAAILRSSGQRWLSTAVLTLGLLTLLLHGINQTPLPF